MAVCTKGECVLRVAESARAFLILVHIKGARVFLILVQVFYSLVLLYGAYGRGSLQ
jgi:hypothetical protein